MECGQGWSGECGDFGMTIKSKSEKAKKNKNTLNVKRKYKKI